MLLRIVLAVALLATLDLRAEDLPPSTKSMQFENDLFAPRQADRWYTQAIRISRSYDVQDQPGFRPAFSFLTDPWCDKKVNMKEEQTCTHRGWSVGQHIFSPADIRQDPVKPDDRPWGGWLYLGGTAQKSDESRQRALEVDIGIIGTRSGARWIQKEWHELINSREPLWNNNLKNELGIFVDYQERRRGKSLLSDSTQRSDFILHYGANAGNVTTSAYGGGTLRWGEGISGFGINIARPSMETPERKRADMLGAESGKAKLVQEWWLFAMAEVRLVAFNVFLDGNMFRSDSPSVDRRPVVADFGIGAHVRLRGNHKLTYAMIKRTREFTAPSDVLHSEQLFGIITYSHDLE